MTPLAPLVARLDRLSALEAKATPGPWREREELRGKDGFTLLGANDPKGLGQVFPARATVADAEFIAALRNAAPQLLWLVAAGEALAECVRHMPGHDGFHPSWDELDEKLAAWDAAAKECE